MSSIIVALMFGVGVAAWVWTKLAKMSGNARPAQVVGAAAAVGLAAFLILLTVLKGILGLD